MKAMGKSLILFYALVILSFFLATNAAAYDPNSPEEGIVLKRKSDPPGNPDNPGKPKGPDKPKDVSPKEDPGPPEDPGKDNDNKDRPKGPSGPSGGSNTGHLYLFAKDPETWEIIEGGPWGKMKYNLSGKTFKFVFNGHQLIPKGEYVLIYYPDPWPGQGLICIGSGVANKGGNVHITGKFDTGTDLPAEGDENFEDGAKIWLVLAADVECGTIDDPTSRMMTSWNPDEYLFEHILITFDYTGE